MSVAIERLRAEILSDREAVARWLDELAALTLGPSADRATLSQAAWALHHGYSGVEALIERTMRVVEGSLPEGKDSHRALLDGAALALDGVRPPLLARETAHALHELRAFRHFVRHAYAVELDGERLAELQRRAIALRPGLEEDLDRLDTWLGELSKALDGL